jgi:hypothetical protein
MKKLYCCVYEDGTRTNKMDILEALNYWWKNKCLVKIKKFL